MLERLVVLGVGYLVRGRGRWSGQPWIYTTAALMALRLVRRVWGRRPVTETLTVGKGETFIVEGLSVSHRNQIRDIKQEQKQQKKVAKQQAKAASGSGRRLLRRR
jgi:hypothetical protein